MISFGTVIEYEQAHYVYFAQINDLVYLGKIIRGELALQVIKRRERVENQSEKGSYRSQKHLNDLAFCFVVLTTLDFENSIAFCKTPEVSSSKFQEIQGRAVLNDQDISELKKELTSGDYPITLQEYVKSLDGFKSS